jgi:hypothetical protein
VANIVRLDDDHIAISQVRRYVVDEELKALYHASVRYVSQKNKQKKGP